MQQKLFSHQVLAITLRDNETNMNLSDTSEAFDITCLNKTLTIQKDKRR